jgi:hypothetical protein
MTRRLLDVLSLIVLATALASPAFLHAQGAVEDRLADGTWEIPRPALPLEPLRTPLPPSYPPRYHPIPPPPRMGLPQIAQAAGIIFSGRVTFVGQSGPVSGHAPAATIITFRVEQAMRGTVPGQSLTIHEWAGLWNSGEHYRVGEHVLLFLYPPSKFGLTSPVSGSLGRFAMDPLGRVLIAERHVGVFATDPDLGGKTAIPYRDFAQAMGRISEKE